MLEAKNISFRVLKNVSLEVKPGEIMALLGPNGAGKSTLLKVLCGEWKAATGTVLLEGKSLQFWRSRQRARSIAVLPQASLLHSDFTVEQVVAMGRAPHGRSEKDREIVQAALVAVDAGDLADRSYVELSGGEQQRVHLARVLAQIWEADGDANRYLLLDEPTANLDLLQQQHLVKAASAMAGRGVGVLMIMHDLNLAAQVATRIMILRDGVTLAHGMPTEVLTSEILEAGFGCSVTVIRHPTSRCPVVLPDIGQFHSDARNPKTDG